MNSVRSIPAICRDHGQEPAKTRCEGCGCHLWWFWGETLGEWGWCHVVAHGSPTFLHHTTDLERHTVEACRDIINQRRSIPSV